MMFLLILNENPIKSAELIPDKLKFKQLIELCQLICSARISNVYKSIKQGKKIQEWIIKNKCWVYDYLLKLKDYAFKNIKIKMETEFAISKIAHDLFVSIEEVEQLTTAIFRYSKDYKCNIPTDTELPIDECIEQYKKYVQWKKDKKVRGYN